VPYVRVCDVVLSRWRTDPHLDNIACLAKMPRPPAMVAPTAHLACRHTTELGFDCQSWPIVRWSRQAARAEGSATWIHSHHSDPPTLLTLGNHVAKGRPRRGP
jgi:hypothetical protein